MISKACLFFEHPLFLIIAAAAAAFVAFRTESSSRSEIRGYAAHLYRKPGLPSVKKHRYDKKEKDRWDDSSPRFRLLVNYTCARVYVPFVKLSPRWHRWASVLSRKARQLSLCGGDTITFFTTFGSLLPQKLIFQQTLGFYRTTRESIDYLSSICVSAGDVLYTNRCRSLLSVQSKSLSLILPLRENI